MPSVFSLIIEGKIPSEKLYESSTLIAIKDIAPVAPVHILIIPKKEIRNLQSMSDQDLPILMEVAKVAQDLAEKFEIDQSGYRLITNCESQAGQTVFHLHFHLIGGKALGPMA